jgi:predicted transcriptional regulator
MTTENRRHTSDIVAAYVRKNFIPPDQVADLIRSVHATLTRLGNDVVEERPLVPAVAIKRSVQPDHIICLECGYKGKMLKRHLQSRHGLSLTEYRNRWKLPSNYPTTAANYREHRSRLAKSIGLGRRPERAAAVPAAVPVPETALRKAARRRSPSKVAKPRTGAEKPSRKRASAKT